MLALQGEALDGEVVLINLNETGAAQGDLSGVIEGGGDGDDLALVDLCLADFDLEERHIGVVIAARAWGIPAADDGEFDLIGLQRLTADHDVLRGDDKLPWFLGGEPPGDDELRRGDAIDDAIALLHGGG